MCGWCARLKSTNDEEKEYRTDDGTDKATNRTRGGNTQCIKHETTDDCTNDTDENITTNAQPSSSHKYTCEPTCS